MKSTFLHLSRAPAWLVPLSITLLMIGLVHSPFFLRQPERLSVGITVDLVVTAPLLYWLMIRRRNIPDVTVLPFFAAGVIVAGIILPEAYQAPLTFVKTWVLPIVELSVLTMVLTRVRQTYRHYRREQSAVFDFYTALQKAAIATLPRGVAWVFTAEIAAFYYSFSGWHKRKLRLNEFSYARAGGSAAILATIIFLVVAETMVIHLLTMRWNTTGAWLLTALSAYTIVQLVGLMRAMHHRPITIDDQHLTLRYGFLRETVIPIGSIVSVAVSTVSPEQEQILQLSPLGALEPSNVFVTLNEPAVLHTMYGARKSSRVISCYVDEPKRMVAAVDKASLNGGAS